MIQKEQLLCLRSDLLLQFHQFHLPKKLLAECCRNKPDKCLLYHLLHGSYHDSDPGHCVHKGCLQAGVGIHYDPTYAPVPLLLRCHRSRMDFPYHRCMKQKKLPLHLYVLRVGKKWRPAVAYQFHH